MSYSYKEECSCGRIPSQNDVITSNDGKQQYVIGCDYCGKVLSVDLSKMHVSDAQRMWHNLNYMEGKSQL